jgi:FkbM family methyltransferase
MHDPSAGYVSQFGQDACLDQRVFCGAENLFFVEIGSADPVDINNTYFLEKQRGWRGLLIEARPSACVALREQRQSEVVNACLSDQVGRSIFLDYGYLAGLCKFMSPREHAYIEQYNSADQEVRAYWVDTLPLSLLLQQRGVEAVPLLILDVEGAELAILSTLNFTAIRVEVILVECNTLEVAKDVGGFLEARDFVLVETLGVDRLFIHAQSPWLPTGLQAVQATLGASH